MLGWNCSLFWIKLWINIDIFTPSIIATKRRKNINLWFVDSISLQWCDHTYMKTRINHRTKVSTKYENHSFYLATKSSIPISVDFSQIWRYFFNKLIVHIEKCQKDIVSKFTPLFSSILIKYISHWF